MAFLGQPEAVTPEDAFKRLKEGNRRFVSAKALRPNQSTLRRQAVLKGQRPFAAVLSCSDSRVPLEIVFDCGIGDLFVVRNMGNALSEAAIAALEYAVQTLGVRFVLVVGHSDCDAVKAALVSDAQAPKMQAALSLLKPAIDKVRSEPGDTVLKAAAENVRMSVAQLRACEPIIAEKVKSGQVIIAGAYYSVGNAVVDFMNA